MRRAIFFVMAFLGTFAGSLVGVETATRAYVDLSSLFILTLFTSGFMIGRAITAIFVGRIFDKNPMQARNIMVSSFILLSIVSILYLFVSVWLYIFLRFMVGMLSGFAWPSVQSILLAASKHSEKNRNMSIYFICGSIGMSTAFLIFAYIDLLTIIIIGVLFYLATAFLGTTLPIETKTFAPNEKRQSIRPQEKENIRIKFILLAVELGMVSAILATDTITGILLDKGFTEMELGIILSITSYIGIIIGMLSSYGSASVSDKYGEKKIILFLSVMVIFSSLGLLLSNDMAIIFISIILLKIYVHSFRPLLVALAKSSGATGLNVGIINASHNASTVILSPTLGFLIENKYTNIITVLVSTIVIIATIIFYRQ